MCLVPYLLRHVTVLPSADQLHSSLARNGSELVVAAAAGAWLGCTLFSGTGTASHPGRCCCTSVGIRVLACRCGWRRTVGVGHPSHPSFFRLPSTLDQVATKVDAAMCQIKAQHALTSRKGLVPRLSTHKTLHGLIERIAILPCLHQLWATTLYKQPTLSCKPSVFSLF